MTQSHRLLIIDDNEEILTSIRNFLQKKDFKVVAATNGLDGLKLFESAFDEFDLVITDLVMPNISGVALISIIKKKAPNVPIIAITGYGEQPEALAREANADIVIEKIMPELIQAAVSAPAEVKFNTYKTASISPRISAQVLGCHVVLGEVVRIGQTIVSLSSVEMAEAQGALLLAGREWKRVKKLGRQVVSESRYTDSLPVLS